MTIRLRTVAVAVLVVTIGMTAACTVASWGEQRDLAALEQRLRAAARAPAAGGADAFDLPAPVERYLRWAVPGEVDLEAVRLVQTGTLRNPVPASRWMRFDARHLAMVPIPGFVWDARVSIFPLLHVRVRDALVEAAGSGRVTFMSAVPFAADGGTMPMNSGSLHRYLAEAVWYPTALRPSRHLRWTPIDAARATATLTAGDLSVSLEFRFAETGEVAAIHTPGRWGSFDGEYRQVAWQGRFRDYRRHGNIAVPMDADVGWYVDGDWMTVWRGQIVTYDPILRE